MFPVASTFPTLDKNSYQSLRNVLKNIYVKSEHHSHITGVVHETLPIRSNFAVAVLSTVRKKVWKYQYSIYTSEEIDMH